MPERQMQLAKINGSGSGCRRKMKMVIIYHLIIYHLNVSGSSFCIYCNKPLVYGNTGKRDLLKHATKSTEHLSSKKNYLSTTFLPLDWGKPTIDLSSEISTCTPLAHECTMSYGVVENVHTTAACPSLKENTLHLIVSVSDHKHHLEAYILSFIAENSLLPSVVPKLIEFSQFLSRDPKALSQLGMNWAATSYKLKHGLSVYVRKKIVDCMKKYPFSINIDECTSNNSQKVFRILVSYFDIEIGESVVQHYESISLVKVNTKSLVERICNCFITDDKTFQNLVLILVKHKLYKGEKR